MTCLVGSHLRLIIRVAERYGSPGLGKADLVQEGCVGLMQALHRFNPDKGARFSTYCIWWIKAAQVILAQESNQRPQKSDAEAKPAIFHPLSNPKS